MLAEWLIDDLQRLECLRCDMELPDPPSIKIKLGSAFSLLAAGGSAE